MDMAQSFHGGEARVRRSVSSGRMDGVCRGYLAEPVAGSVQGVVVIQCVGAERPDQRRRWPHSPLPDTGRARAGSIPRQSHGRGNKKPSI